MENRCFSVTNNCQEPHQPQLSASPSTPPSARGNNWGCTAAASPPAASTRSGLPTRERERAQPNKGITTSYQSATPPLLPEPPTRPLTVGAPAAAVPVENVVGGVVAAEGAHPVVEVRRARATDNTTTQPPASSAPGDISNGLVNAFGFSNPSFSAIVPVPSSGSVLHRCLIIAEFPV